MQAIDAASLSADLKESVKKSVATHAVALLVRLKAADNEDEVTVANIHCAYDKLQRPDRRCIQVFIYSVLGIPKKKIS